MSRCRNISRLDSQSYEKEKIPADFTPFRRFQENNFKGNKNLTAEERAKILGERIKIGDQPEKEEIDQKEADERFNEKSRSFLAKLSEGSKKLLAFDNKFVSGGTTFDPTTEEIDYFEDKQKNDRFKLYVARQESNFTGAIPWPPGYRGSDIDKEMKEFERYFQIWTERKEKEQLFKTDREKLLMQINDLKQKIEVHKKKRIREDWLPDKVVCIRFGVAQPKKLVAPTEEIVFDEKVMPALEKDLKQHKFAGIKLDDSKPDQKLEKEIDKVIMPDENNIDLPKAPQDLFDSIFN
jgi:hypothetical protein